MSSLFSITAGLSAEVQMRQSSRQHKAFSPRSVSGVRQEAHTSFDLAPAASPRGCHKIVRVQVLASPLG